MREEPLRRCAKGQAKRVRGQLQVAPETKSLLRTEGCALLQRAELQGRTAIRAAAKKVNAVSFQRHPYSIGERNGVTDHAVLSNQAIKARIARPSRDRIA